jgi:hypothetical protein
VLSEIKAATKILFVETKLFVLQDILYVYSLNFNDFSCSVDLMLEGEFGYVDFDVQKLQIGSSTVYRLYRSDGVDSLIIQDLDIDTIVKTIG